MNNEKLMELINSEKEILSTLPKNNKKNISKYIETLTKYKEDYSKMSVSLKKEIEKRRDKVTSKASVNKDLDNLKNKVLDLKKNIYLFNDYNSSYEKSGLDKVLYNLSNKGNKSLIEFNNDIKTCLSIFKKAGVMLGAEDFKYAPSAYFYMKEYFKYIDNLEDERLKNSFEKIYWRFPDIIVHIELSIKYLYYKNIKYFDKYYSNLRLSIRKDYDNELIECYKKTKINYDKLVQTDIYTIYEKFLSKEYNISDYKENKIKQSIEALTSLDINSNYEKIIDSLSKLYNSIEEYQSYLEFKYVIDAVKDIYKEKDKYKDSLKNKRKEIMKLEKKLFKINRKIYSLLMKDNKEKQLDKLYMENLQIIKSLKELYDSLEKDKFNEQVMKLSDNFEIIEILKLANSYYIFQAELLLKSNEDISLLDIDNSILKLTDYIISPYNTIINNIDIVSDDDLVNVIYNIYSLNGLIIDKDSLGDESNLDNLLNLIRRILVFDCVNKSVFSICDIEFVLEANDCLSE
ncbi:MAG: hypothetical protein ACI31R_04445 [Bacilli bacterium]